MSKKLVLAFLGLFLLFFNFLTLSNAFAATGCATEETLINNGYTGACGYASYQTFTLSQEKYVTRIRVWFYIDPYSFGGGGDFFVLKDSAGNTIPTTISSSSCSDSYWCERYLTVNASLAAGTYKVEGTTSNICSNPSGQTTLIVYGCGSSSPPPSTPSSMVVTCDLNGDGKDDIVFKDANGSIKYSTNLTAWTNVTGTLGKYIACGDLNGDKKADIIGVNNDNSIWHTLNLGTNWSNIPGGLSRIFVSDFNGDGKADVFGLNDSGNMYVTYNLSTFSNIPGSLSDIIPGNFSSTRAGNEFAGINSNGNIYYTNDFSNMINVPGSLAKVFSGEINGDGRADLLGLNAQNEIFYTTNLSTWTYIPGNLVYITTGDLNGNGINDIVGFNSSGDIYYTTNLSSWSNIPGKLSNLVTGDLNGDKKADVTGIGNDGNVYYTTDLSNWNVVGGGSNDDGFTYGTPKIYDINSTTDTSIKDDITGDTFRFPNGGQGKLTVTPILNAPDTDTSDSGFGFQVEYTGSDTILFSLSYNSGELPALWIWDEPQLNPQGSAPIDKMWIPVSQTNKIYNNIALFDITNISQTFLNIDDNKSMQEKYNNPENLWKAKLNEAGWFGKLQFYSDEIELTLATILAMLPASLKENASKEIDGRLNYAINPLLSHYNPFVHNQYAPHFSYLTGNPSPAFYFGWNSQQRTIVHETGHYLSHVLIGDNLMKKLALQARGGHEIGHEHPERPMLEEYAYFTEFSRLGTMNGADIGVSAVSLEPTKKDTPAIEGYPARLLALMTLEKPKSTPSYFLYGTEPGLGINEDIPTINISLADIWKILAEGKPTDVNELYTNIEQLLSQKSISDRLPAFLERTGWSYNGTGKIVNAQKQGIANARLQAVSKAPSEGTNKEYFAPLEKVTTGSDGSFKLDRIFPGKNFIRVWTTDNNATFVNIPLVEIDPKKPTQDTLSLGDLIIGPNIDSISPTSGQAGTTVTITGSGFGTSSDTRKVNFGSTSISGVTWSSDGTTATFTVPAGTAAGSYDVTVEVNGVKSNAKTFTIGSVTPVISSISPTSGKAGATVTITGSGFGTSSDTRKVNFGATSISGVTWSSDGKTATFAVPTGTAAGSYDITVEVNGVKSNAKTFTFASPDIDRVNFTTDFPNNIDTVSIEGSGFGTSSDTRKVNFGSTSISSVTWSSDGKTATFTVPARTAFGNYDVTVEVNGVKSNVYGFSFYDCPDEPEFVNPCRGALKWGKPYMCVTETGCAYYCACIL